MTRKENLRNLYIEKSNELLALQGQTCNASHYAPFAGERTINEWEQSIKNVEASIERTRIEKEQKAAVDAYFATEEGKARKEALLKEQEATLSAMTELTENREAFFKEWIKEYLGSHWTLRDFCDSRIEFAMVDPKNEEKFVFAQFIEINYGPNWWGKGERFETNVGTTGAFSILESEQGDRARYYIDLGKFLSDKKRLEELKAALFAYNSRLKELRQIYLNIEKELANPTIDNLGL